MPPRRRETVCLFISRKFCCEVLVAQPNKVSGKYREFYLFFWEITHPCPLERLYQPRAIKYLLPNFGGTLGGKAGDGGGKGAKVTAKTLPLRGLFGYGRSKVVGIQAKGLMER